MADGATPILRRKVWRDLGRRRSQIAAVSVTVFLGILLFASNHDAANNLDASYREMYDRLDFADVWASGGPTDAVVEAFVSDPDVTAVATRTRFDAPLRIGDRSLVGTVIGVPVDGEPAINDLLVLDGRAIGADDAEASVAVVEQHGWDTFDLREGDTIEVRGTSGWSSLDVVGGAASAEYVWLAPNRQQIFTVPDEFAVVFVPEPLAADLAPGPSAQVTAIVADHDEASAARLVDAARELGATDAYARADQPSNSALQGDVTGFEQLSFLFPFLFLTVAGMAAFVLLGRIVRTERPQIGMMVANGVSTRTVRHHYTTHAAVAVTLGLVPGLVLGALVGRWISGLYTGFLGIPITVIRFTPATILWSLGFGVVVTALAGGLPARAAARIEPAEAMRPPAPTGVSRRSVLERLWPGEAPEWVRMVARGVSRGRRRFWTTALGVVLAMVLLIVSLGMADTVFSVIDRQFDEVDRRDLTVTLDAPADDAVLAELETRDAVATAERFAEVPASLVSGDARVDQLVQAFEADTAAHGFDEPLPDGAIVLGSSARDALDVSVGDEVEVVVPGLAAPIEVPVGGFVDEPVPSISYVSIGTWVDLGAPPPDRAVLTLVEPDRHAEVRAALQDAPGVAAVVDDRATVQAIEDVMGLTYVFVGLMVAFAVVMAIALIYNMVSVSLSERTGEVATLQANGVGRRFVRRTVTGENVLTVLAGIVPGLVIGWFVAKVFLGQFETESISFELVLSPWSVLLSVALVLVAALVAEWPGLRALDRIDLASVVRERSE